MGTSEQVCSFVCIVPSNYTLLTGTELSLLPLIIMSIFVLLHFPSYIGSGYFADNSDCFCFFGRWEITADQLNFHDSCRDPLTGIIQNMSRFSTPTGKLVTFAKLLVCIGIGFTISPII